jgi:hypothetical protein
LAARLNPDIPLIDLAGLFPERPELQGYDGIAW